MNYYLYKLKFSTSVHFGNDECARSLESIRMNFCADTLFSALCHIAVKAQCIDKLVSLVQNNEILFSDSMPYDDKHFYIPKPVIPSTKRSEIDPSIIKKMKKIDYIPVSEIDSFLLSLKGDKTFMQSLVQTNFGTISAFEKVALRGEESEPYSVAAYTFNKDCGLYGIIGYSSEERLNYVLKLMEILGMEGIGGKISTGYGKFTIDDELYLDEPVDEESEILNRLLYNENSNKYILLTSAFPKDEELDRVIDGSSYSLSRKSGFVNSNKISKPIKKNTQYFFSAGSVFKMKFSGDLYDVGKDMPHCVYRYAKPIFLGVSL